MLSPEKGLRMPQKKTPQAKKQKLRKNLTLLGRNRTEVEKQKEKPRRKNDLLKTIKRKKY